MMLSVAGAAIRGERHTNDRPLLVRGRARVINRHFTGGLSPGSAHQDWTSILAERAGKMGVDGSKAERSSAHVANISGLSADE